MSCDLKQYNENLIEYFGILLPQQKREQKEIFCPLPCFYINKQLPFIFKAELATNPKIVLAAADLCFGSQ